MRKTFAFLLPFFTVLVFVGCKNDGKSNASLNAEDSVLHQPDILRYTNAIQQAPDRAPLYFDRGLALHTLAEDSLALKDYLKAISLDSSKAEYYSAVGDLLFEHKDVTGSVAWLKKAVELNPNDKRAHLKIAKMFLFARDFPQAFTEINTVLRTDAFNPEGYYLKGMVYREMKDTNKAISSLQTAVNVAPDYRDAHLQLGFLYSAQRNPLALQYFDNAFRLDTSSVTPLYAKGLFYQHQEKYETAKEEYKQAILKDPDYAGAYFATGFILMQQDSFEKARRQYDLVTKIEVDNAEAYYNRGLCSELMDRKEDARSDYQTALKFSPNYKEAKAGMERLK